MSDFPQVSRRTFLQVSAPAAAATTLVLQETVKPQTAEAGTLGIGKPRTGARLLVESLQAHQVCVIFGIPGAQENELWDEFKQQGLDYVLVTHEQSAAMMADGYARASGKPGVIAIVPGPGITNALTGIGEAKLDSIPMVCIVGDIAKGKKYHPFQVHELPTVDLLRPVTKCVIEACQPDQISNAIQQAFCTAQSGEPGPVAVVIPYPVLVEQTMAPIAAPIGYQVSCDEPAIQRAIACLAKQQKQVGIYAGLGCMNYSPQLTKLAEVLQAPVATSVSGKGVIDERHPLAVGWGYGPQGTRAAEQTFKKVDVLLAIGVKFSEVSTALYSVPDKPTVIHVDAEANNIGRILPADIPVHADAGIFLEQLLAHESQIRRTQPTHLVKRIANGREDDHRQNQPIADPLGIDPMQTIMALRQSLPCDGLLYVDVTCAEHWAAEVFTTMAPRTYFNPTDNQAMGWSIPAAMGGQRACPGRTVATLTGDGCFWMTAMELATAVREQLPVKFFILHDNAYHYMQALQKPAYMRTTATILPHLDFGLFAQAIGLPYLEVCQPSDLCATVSHAVATAGPVLVRIKSHYPERKIRWIQAVRNEYLDELKTGQKLRMLTRLGARTVRPGKRIND